MSGPPRTFGDRRGQVHPDWVVQAPCRQPGIEPNDFHPEVGRDFEATKQRAKAVCTKCPLRARCRDWGNAVSPDWGIFGGLTASERKARLARRGVVQRAVRRARSERAA